MEATRAPPRVAGTSATLGRSLARPHDAPIATASASATHLTSTRFSFGAAQRYKAQRFKAPALQDASERDCLVKTCPLGQEFSHVEDCVPPSQR